MSTYLLPDQNECYHPTSLNTQNQTQTAQQHMIINLHANLLATLPKAKAWRSEHVFLYKGFWLSSEVIKGLLLIHYHFTPQPTDIYLAAFMKCGTTWLKALMFATANRHRYKLSNHPLLRTGPQSAFPFLDTHIFLDYPVTHFEHLPAPRLFATHFAHGLLPTSMTSSTCKFVYVCRDPKDALVSKWHFMSKLRSKELAPLSFNEAYELFCNGVSEYGPFWDHVLGYWKASQESPDKILFLKYEDMKREPAVELKKLAAFMGMPFTAEEEDEGVVEEIVKLCSFENLSHLKVNKGGGGGGGQMFTSKVVVENHEFFRKGKVGDWENYLTEEMKDRIDLITGEKLKGSGLTLGVTK